MSGEITIKGNLSKMPWTDAEESKGVDGASVKRAYIDENGKLFFVLTDNTTINAGHIYAPLGDVGKIAYYGRMNITPTNQNSFTWVYDDTHGTAKLTDINVGPFTKVVIPYEVTHNNRGYRVTEIDRNVLYGDGNVAELVMPTTITAICDGAFSDFGVLLRAEIPRSLTFIPRALFRNCTNLADVVIPKTISEIKEKAFENCTGLADVYYEGSEAEWQAITIGDYNTELTSATIHYNHVPAYKTDLESYSTTTQMNTAIAAAIASALTPVYKIKGSINPEALIYYKPEMGYVYNVVNASTSTEMKRETSYSINDLTVTETRIGENLSSYAFNGTYAENVINDLIKGSKVTISGGSFYVTDISNGTVYGTPIDRFGVHAVTHAYIIPPITVKSGDNVVWTDKGFDKLAADIDLSEYSTTTQMNSAISTAIATALAQLGAADVSYDNSQSSLDASTVQEAIDKIAELLPGKIENWRQVQDVVRRGLASSYFKIGDTFEVKKGNNTLVFDLIGIDEDIPASSTAEVIGTGITAVDVDYFTLLKQEGTAGEFDFTYHNNVWRDNFGDTVTLANYGITATGTAAEGDSIKVSIPHNITLKLHDTSTTESIVFDAPECTYYLLPEMYPNGLAAGTYHFDMHNKTYQFTLTATISSGGALRVNTSSAKIAAFNNVSQERATESVSYIEGSGGTGLPLVSSDYDRYGRNNGLNQSQFGINEYSESCIRQLINTRLSSDWWEAQSHWDRPGNTSKAGFLNNVDTEFLGVIKPVLKKTKQSHAYGDSIVVTQEKLFLLSISEVYGGTNMSGDEGEPYSFFGVGSSSLPSPGSGADTNRIIKSGNTAKSYWLRSRFPSEPKATQVAVVKADGSINAILAYNTVIAAVPCCVIY